MNKKTLNKGATTRNSTGTGPVTRAMVHVRTRELALIAGRVPPHVARVDYEQAKLELTGEPDLDRQDAMLDSISGTERWDPVPGSTGHQAPESPSEDEDAEGQCESAQLVAGGVEEAELDQMLQAATVAAKKDQQER